MNYKEAIAAILQQALTNSKRAISKDQSWFSDLLEAPKDSQHGDFAFPCFSLAKELRLAPPLIAKELLPEVSALVSQNQQLSKVEVLGPYLNFFVNKSQLAAGLIPSILSGEFLKTRTAQKEKMMIEYSQPNTHKAFHVGHVRCASLGDSLVRIFEWVGHEVVASNYIGDEGTHVAKCLWHYKNYFRGTPPETHRGEFLGDQYAKATLLLDLSLMTRVPIPRVVAAKVLEVQPHAEVKDRRVVKLDTGSGVKLALTGGVGFEQGDIIPFALVGAYINDRQVEVIEKFGIRSEGLVCSEQELGLSDQKYKVPVLDSATKLGTELADIYRIPGTLAENVSVLAEMRRREAEVSKLLQAMEAKEPEIHQLWQLTKEWSMQELYEVYRWLNCRFDHYFYESEFGESSKKLVLEFKKKGVFVESDGAVGADLKQYGLGFCLLIKRDGTVLYATRDLTLAQRKFEQYKIDRSLYVVDAGQTLHFKQVFKCLELMGYSQAARCHHLGYGIVTLPDGKMSSRKGNVILFSQLQERLLNKINSEFLNKYQGDWSEQEIANAGHKIALATMRYGMLNQDNNSNIIFDLDAWTAKTGNTGPYMMYAYARVQSILREAGKLDRSQADWSLLTHESEAELVTHLAGYHAAVQYAAEQYSPLAICTYVYELAKRFSRMYQNCSVLNAESEALKVTRASLVEAAGRVIQHALGLLGIETVDRM